MEDEILSYHTHIGYEKKEDVRGERKDKSSGGCPSHEHAQGEEGKDKMRQKKNNVILPSRATAPERAKSDQICSAWWKHHITGGGHLIGQGKSSKPSRECVEK